MKSAKIKTNNICDTCSHHYVIAGCECCGKCGPNWWCDLDGKFHCNDYEKKKEVNNEKKDSNA